MLTHYPTSYWQKNSFGLKSDYAVIGAGICGLSTALFLKQKHPNAQVHVYEREFIPDGASVRNAGFACIGSVGELLADQEHLSLEQQRHLVEERYRGLELMRAVLGNEAIGYEACGSYELFESEEEKQKVFDAIAQYNEILRPISGGEAVFEQTTINGKEAVFNVLEGAIHTGKMMKSLVEKVREAGVHLHFNCPVKQGNHPDEWLVGNELSIDASKIILCTNGYTQELMENCSIRPARGYVLLTEDLKNMPWKGTYHMHQGYVYFRNVGKKLLLGGFRQLDLHGEESLTYDINPIIKNSLLRLAHDFLEIPKNINIEKEWVGHMGFTPSGLPEIQEIGNKTLLAGGFNGMGVALGMGFGKKVAEYCTK